METPFLPQKGNYRNLIAYQKAECIYDITYNFAHHFLERSDRTIDQMVQAARSGKQNIAEGEIKLVNVARASLQELLIDYEDYLRVRDLTKWDINDRRAIVARRVCAKHNESSFYRNAIQVRTDETIANIAITLIYQEDVILRKYLDHIKEDFIKHGGIREQMTRARIEYRNKQ